MVKTEPCFNCEKRYVGCHADCEDYKAWKADRADAQNKRYHRKADESMLNHYTIKSALKNSRKKWKER